MTDFQMIQAIAQIGVLYFFYYMQHKDGMHGALFVLMIGWFALAGTFDLIIPAIVYIFNFVQALVS